jgi:hypothetical protein
MLVVTRYRPAGPISDLPTLLDELTDIRNTIEGGVVAGTSGPRVLLNEARMELIILAPIDKLSDLDRVEANDDNTRLGLRLIKAGLMLVDTEYWRDIPGEFARYRRIFSSL